MRAESWVVQHTDQTVPSAPCALSDLPEKQGRAAAPGPLGTPAGSPLHKQDRPQEVGAWGSPGSPWQEQAPPADEGLPTEAHTRLGRHWGCTHQLSTSRFRKNIVLASF